MVTVHIYDAMCVLRSMMESGKMSFDYQGLLAEQNQSGRISFWCWEGKGSLNGRRSKYPAYKAKRPPAGESIFKGVELIKNLLKNTNAWQIEIPGYEADDVIGALIVQYGGRLPIEVHTTDFDLAQLHNPDLNINVRSYRENKTPPELIRLYKATVGDPSDNIIGIKGFGDKAFETVDKQKLQSFYDHKLSAKDVGFKPKTLEWVEENMEEVRAAYEIVGLLPISNSFFHRPEHITQGVYNPSASTDKLKEFFL